jgi:hypothetical protein
MSRKAPPARRSDKARVRDELAGHYWREGITPGTSWTVEKLSRNIHRVTMLCDTPHGFEWHGLLSSDRHHDNAHTNQDLERKHLEELQRRKGGCLDCGDGFCAMQGRFDLRADRSALRPEYQAGDYLDALVREATRFYAPFADRFVMIGRGNHETAIQKRHETDLTERLCAGLSAAGPCPVYSGGYGGWVLFRLISKHGGSFSWKIRYFHGAGGGAVMTHGVLDTRRHASLYPDADMVITGHSHHHWVVPIARERIRQFLGQAEVVVDEQTHVRIGTYKDEHGDGYGGWSVEKGLPPKGLGAVWMRLFIAGTQKDYRLAAEVTRAT